MQETKIKSRRVDLREVAFIARQCQRLFRRAKGRFTSIRCRLMQPCELGLVRFGGLPGGVERLLGARVLLDRRGRLVETFVKGF
jgi:hypothetical protein